jgi:hypothetical protein
MRVSRSGIQRPSCSAKMRRDRGEHRQAAGVVGTCKESGASRLGCAAPSTDIAPPVQAVNDLWILRRIGPCGNGICGWGAAEGEYRTPSEHGNFEARQHSQSDRIPATGHRNDLAPTRLFRSACVTRKRNTRYGTRIIALAYRHPVADYSSDLVARWPARLMP